MDIRDFVLSQYLLQQTLHVRFFSGATTRMPRIDSWPSLTFYRRIFPIAQLRIVLLVMAAIVLCFTFTFVMIVIFQWFKPPTHMRSQALIGVEVYRFTRSGICNIGLQHTA